MENPAVADQTLISDPIKVMVVDDSAVIRGFLTKFLEANGDIKVVCSASNGERALQNLQKSQIEVVILDIEMPVMNGLETLPKILEFDPQIQVIMASTLTTEGASVTLEALQIGAAECLAKPSSTQGLVGTSDFRYNLVTKARELGRAARKRRQKREGGSPATQAGGGDMIRQQTKSISTAIPAPPKTFVLRPETYNGPFDAIAIGSSTGGPQALLHVFGELKDGIRQPIFITQHMPATFTAILADHISKQSGLVCAEAKDGEEIKGGRIYLAPGGFHMTVKIVDNKKRVISLNQDPPENFCRPAVDPMLRSLTLAYGKKVAAIILTGMGTDGLKGGRNLIEAGGTIIAQDEDTSIVWGMPGAVATAGICSRVIPLARVAATIKELAARV